MWVSIGTNVCYRITMFRRNFLGAMAVVAAISCTALASPILWAARSEACDEMVGILCAGVVVILSPLIVAALLAGNSLLLARYFNVSNAFIYAWTAFVVPVGTTWVTIHTFFMLPHLLLFAGIIVVITVGIGWLLRLLVCHLSRWVALLVGVLLSPVLVVSLVLVLPGFDMRTAIMQQQNQVLAERRAKLHNLNFRPFVHMDMDATVVEARSSQYEPSFEVRGDSQYLVLGYERFYVIEYADGRYPDGLSVCEDMQTVRSSIVCRRVGALSDGTVVTFASSADYLNEHEYLLVRNGVIIDARPNTPNDAEALQFIEKLHQVDAASLEPKPVY